MKKILSILLILALAAPAGIAAAQEDTTGLLGNPFPDFTVTDTEGNTFTLSEALKDHEAVLINFWATWCVNCVKESPYLESVWKKYGDRVAFIALSAEPKDTMEKVTAFREENGISFPVGLDAEQKLFGTTGKPGFPVTVIVDRFGNAVFKGLGAFLNEGEAERVLESFLGDDYTESAVLEKIPADASTGAFPVSAKRAAFPENENVKEIRILHEGSDLTTPCYLVPDETAHILLETGPEDNPFKILYQDCRKGCMWVTDLYDPARNAFAYDQEIEGTFDGEAFHFNYGLLADGDLFSNDPDRIMFFLIRDEQYIGECTDLLTRMGYKVSGWEYAEEKETAEENAPKAYILHVVDQDNLPVEEVYVNFCTDVACVPRESDGNGVITFDGAPDTYHVQIIDIPDGYSFDETFEFHTTREYGEWVLRVSRDEQE